jgi:hypothetical protein
MRDDLSFEGEGMRRLISGLALFGVLVTGAAACNNNNTTTTTTTPTTTTTAATITEPLFTGNLKVNGAATYPFTATTGGTITATLTTLAPDTTTGIGLSLGTWNGSACQIVIANDNATPSIAISGTVTAASSLCVRVYDVGRLASPVDFSVTIVHP